MESPGGVGDGGDDGLGSGSFELRDPRTVLPSTAMTVTEPDSGVVTVSELEVGLGGFWLGSADRWWSSSRWFSQVANQAATTAFRVSGSVFCSVTRMVFSLGIEPVTPQCGTREEEGLCAPAPDRAVTAGAGEGGADRQGEDDEEVEADPTGVENVTEGVQKAGAGADEDVEIDVVGVEEAGTLPSEEAP